MKSVKHGLSMAQYLEDEAATVAFGERLGQVISSGAVLFLNGDLGAGKTTLSRGILRAFGHSGAVKSPTYTLVEPYDFGDVQVYHFDLYRLGDPEELEYMGIRDYFTESNVCLVEWPGRGEGVLPVADLVVTLTARPPGRELTLVAQTDKGGAIVQHLNKASLDAD